MKKIKLTHGKVTLVDDEDFEYLNKFRWHAKIFPCGVYAKRIKWSSRKLGKRKGETINMESAIMGKKDGFIIDHKDGNGLNNQKSNLRFCTYKQNSMNKISRKGSSSKYKGVSWYPPTKK